MDERIKEHLKHLQRYQLHLKDSQKIPQEQFINDDIRVASVERFLHLAIESCLNIGNRLISILQFEVPIETPETYADIFVSLFRMKILNKALSDRMVLMAKFRNRLDLEYEKILGMLNSMEMKTDKFCFPLEK